MHRRKKQANIVSKTNPKSKHTLIMPIMASGQGAEPEQVREEASESKAKTGQSSSKWKYVVICAAFMLLLIKGIFMAAIGFFYISLIERFSDYSLAVISGSISVLSGVRHLSGKLEISIKRQLA